MFEGTYFCGSLEKSQKSHESEPRKSFVPHGNIAFDALETVHIRGSCPLIQVLLSERQRIIWKERLKKK